MKDSKHKMETDRLKAEGLKLNGFIRGNPSAWWPEGPADSTERTPHVIIFKYSKVDFTVESGWFCACVLLGIVSFPSIR